MPAIDIARGGDGVGWGGVLGIAWVVVGDMVVGMDGGFGQEVREEVVGWRL